MKRKGLSNEKKGARGAISTQVIVESTDELRERREPCLLYHHCAEFVCDSHALKLRVLALTLGVELLKCS
jgi:hypothetical protein